MLSMLWVWEDVGLRRGRGTDVKEGWGPSIFLSSAHLAGPGDRAVQTCLGAKAPKRSHFPPVTWEAPEPVPGPTQQQPLLSQWLSLNLSFLEFLPAQGCENRPVTVV